MTSPFQSIIGTPEVGEQVERDECNLYSEEVAEDIRAELEAISVAPQRKALRP